MNALGIDIGTTSLSFALVDTEQRKLLKSVTVQNDTFLRTSDTWEKVQEPDIIWEKTKKVLEEFQLTENNVARIGLTGQMHGILYTDESGRAASPLYTWQDESGQQEMEPGITYAAYLSEVTGLHMASGFGGTTYFYHVKNKNVPENAVSFCTIMDYIGMKLTGRTTPLTDASNAAGIGLFDVKNRIFDREAIKKAELDINLFPEIAANTSTLGYTKGNIRVTVAVGDNQASFLGAVRDPEHSILVNIGTGSQISMLTSVYKKVEGMETRPFIEDKYLLAASPLCGGRAYALLEEFFEMVVCGFQERKAEEYRIKKADIYDWMDSMLQKMEREDAIENKLCINPQFSGTRIEPSIRGTIQNIGINNFTPQAFTYGILEGMANELYELYSRIDRESQNNITYAVCSGNGIRKNIHLQKIIREIFGLRIELPMNEEEAACGAAYIS